jgi:hypothetical protein
MGIRSRRKRYRLGGEFAFRDLEGVDHLLPVGTELGPKALAGFSDDEIAIHVSTGRFVEITPSDCLQSVVVRAT